MRRILKRLWKEEVAQDLVEYALLLVMVSLAVIASMKVLSNGVGKAYSAAASNLTVSGGNGGGNGGGDDGGGGGNGGDNGGGRGGNGGGGGGRGN